ncbi:MAG: 50S ribosomal protein L11 methyltransferase [Candidatus Omnitrophica bacterium]|nr:50S ribosomal protein L11 methyltransferase [Candidatus Omnitrophota bacterium]
MSKQIHRQVFEVTLSFSAKKQAAIEIIRSVLCGLGVPDSDIIEQTIDGRIGIVFYCQTRKEAERFVVKLVRLQMRGVKISSNVLYQDDWLTRWKKDWKPFALTSSLDVVPVWCKDQYSFGRRSFILLDTISSFGTGLHETTRFMCQFIEGLKGKFDSCMDVGTGTGILALVALKVGAGQVCAIDFDEMCVCAAKANFEANGYSTENIFQRDVSKFKSQIVYDLVAANLVTHDLLSFKNQILSFVRPGGWLAVSGISLENLPILKKGFKGLPLRCIKTTKGKYWSAVLFKRSL